MHAIALPASLPSPTPTLVGLAPLKDAQEAEALSFPHHYQAEHIIDDMVMRQWTYADLETVWSMHNSLLPLTLHLPRTHFQTLFHTPHSHILLSFSATDPTDPIGFCVYSVLPGTPNVVGKAKAAGPATVVFRSLGVGREWRGRGVARGMVERVLAEAKAMGGEEVGGGRVRVMVWLKRGGGEEEMVAKLLGGLGGGGLKREGRGGWWGGLV